MKISFFQVSIECERCELSDAIQALREIASIAPVSAPSARPLPVSAPCDALRDLLRIKGISFKFRPDGKDKGETLESALVKACKAAGVSESDIASALSSAPMGESLEGMEVQSAESMEDTGESFF